MSEDNKPYEQQDPAEDPSTKKLIARLLELQAPDIMLQRARRGEYHDFRTSLATPTIQLWQDAGMFGLPETFLQEILNDEYAAGAEESEAWFQSIDGQSSIDKLIDGE